MSQFLPDEGARPVQPATTQPGPAADRNLIQRVFRDPNLIPEGFWSYAADLISSVYQPQIPISQISGFTQFTALSNVIVTDETTASTTYADLATVGPQLTGVPDGMYVFLYGAAMASNSNAAATARMSIQVDSTTASDSDAALSQEINGTLVSTSIAVVKTLSGLPAGGHTITAKYRHTTVSFTAEYANRWLIGLRYANL